MKKYNFQWFLGLLALSLLFLGSCSKLDENQTYIESPFITFVEFDGADTLNMVSEDDTVNINTPFGIFVSATSNLLTNDRLRDITVSISMNGVTQDSTYEINDTTYAMLHIFIPIRNGQRQISFTVEDNAGNTASISVNVFVKGDKMSVIKFPTMKSNSIYNANSIIYYKSNEALYYNNICMYAFKTPKTTTFQNFYYFTGDWNSFANTSMTRTKKSSIGLKVRNIQYKCNKIVYNQYKIFSQETGNILKFNTSWICLNC